jgi:2-haloacid dehalogenase
MRPTTVVFDLGGVLIDWDPRYAYRQMGGTEAEIEHFLEHVATSGWNHQFDAVKPFAEGIAERKERFPDHAEWIEAWWSRWPDMLGGAIDGTVQILRELRDAGTPLYALTNWSAETFPIARERFDFLDWFDGIVVSGEVEKAKPDADIFAHLSDDFGIVPAEAVFIDDSAPNVATARRLGFHGIDFTTPAALRADLARLGLPVAPPDASPPLTA